MLCATCVYELFVIDYHVRINLLVLICSIALNFYVICEIGIELKIIVAKQSLNINITFSIYHVFL